MYDDGPKLERLCISSIHILKSRNLIVTLFGGANGGGMRGGCNLKYYLCLVRKLLEKLVGVCKPFEDAWLIDWDNDCADDVWTLRLVLKPSAETLAEIADCRYVVDQVKESIGNDECMQYVDAFKEKLGYVDGYMPKKDIDDAADSLARECALRMPTDTMAREIEGDAVILLVLSGDEEAVKAGKKLGDCMMNKGKHDEETLLKLMSDAYKAMNSLEAKQEAAKHAAIQKAKDTLPAEPYESEDDDNPMADVLKHPTKSMLPKQLYHAFPAKYLSAVKSKGIVPSIESKNKKQWEQSGDDITYWSRSIILAKTYWAKGDVKVASVPISEFDYDKLYIDRNYWVGFDAEASFEYHGSINASKCHILTDEELK